MSAAPISISRHPQLFLDDHLLVRTQTIRRRLLQPRKHPANPVLDGEHPWETRMLQYPVVLHEPERNLFCMWYTAFGEGRLMERGAICYAESKDGLHWQKPMLDLRAFEGRQTTNILLSEPAESCFMSVIKTPHEPDSLYKGLYWHRVKKSWEAQYPDLRANLVTTSTDGIHWQTPEPVIFGKSDNPPSLVWYEPEQKYFAYLRDQAQHPDLFGHIRVTGISESADFENWIEKEMMILTDEDEGYPYTQVHALTATVYGDLLLGMLSVIKLEEEGNNFLGIMNVQLACSRDGRNWHRIADRATFLDIGPESWDRWFVHAGSLLVHNDTIHVYYHGWPVKHGHGRKNKGRTPNPNASRPKGGGIGLATLPADRFVALSLESPGTEAIVETKPLYLSGTNLLLNAEAGQLQIELLDEKGTPIPGFTAATSRLIPRDRLRHRVLWNDRPLGAAPITQPISLRFILRDADLYAFQIE